MALVTVIQLTELTGVHVQLVPLTTESELVLPMEETDTLVGETLYEQLEAAWLKVTVWPATAIVPVRATPVEFAATV